MATRTVDLGPVIGPQGPKGDKGDPSLPVEVVDKKFRDMTEPGSYIMRYVNVAPEYEDAPEDDAWSWRLDMHSTNPRYLTQIAVNTWGTSDAVWKRDGWRDSDSGPWNFLDWKAFSMNDHIHGNDTLYGVVKEYDTNGTNIDTIVAQGKHCITNPIGTVPNNAKRITLSVEYAGYLGWPDKIAQTLIDTENGGVFIRKGNRPNNQTVTWSEWTSVGGEAIDLGMDTGESWFDSLLLDSKKENGFYTMQDVDQFRVYIRVFKMSSQFSIQMAIGQEEMKSPYIRYFNGTSWATWSPIAIIESVHEVSRKLPKVINGYTITAASWESNSTYSALGYNWRAALSMSDVSVQDQPSVAFSAADAVSGNFAPFSESYNGGVYIYSKTKPTANMQVNLVLNKYS